MAVVQDTYTHTNNTENDTKQTIHERTHKLGRVKAVPRLCGFYLGFDLKLRKKHGTICQVIIIIIIMFSRTSCASYDKVQF